MQKSKFILLAIVIIATATAFQAYKSAKRLYYLNTALFCKSASTLVLSTSVAGQQSVATPSDFSIGWYTTSVCTGTIFPAAYQPTSDL